MARTTALMRGTAWWMLGLTLFSAAPARGLELIGHQSRWSLGGYLDGYAVVKTEGDSSRQRPAGVLAVQLDGDVTPEIRSYFDVRTTFGGPPEGANGFAVVNLVDTFQNSSPTVEFEEGYVDVFLRGLDLRVGKQKFSWGRLDIVTPTDVLDPRRYTDPFLTDELDSKIGVPAVQGIYYPKPLPDTRLTLVWVPLPVPFRFPLENQRWFPTSLTFDGLDDLGIDSSQLPGEIPIDLDFRTANSSPGLRLANGSLGLRVSGLSAGVDWATYYYTGPETRPGFNLETSVVSPNAQRLVLEGQTPELTDLPPLLARATLRPRFRNIWLVGADFSTPIGGFIARAEAAYGSDRLLSRPVSQLFRDADLPVAEIINDLKLGKEVPVDLGDLTVARDMLSWGAALEYAWRDWIPILQLNQRVVLNNSAKLLVPDTDTSLIAIIRKPFLSERLLAELTAWQGFERSFTATILRLTYSYNDHLLLRAGYLFLAGSRNTEIGQYKDNDEVFFNIRYSL